MTGPVERYEAENKKFVEKRTLLSTYTWLAVAPEDSRAENPVTTVTVFSRFTVFHVKNTWARDGGLEKLHRLFFSGSGALGSEALGYLMVGVYGNREVAILQVH